MSLILLNGNLLQMGKFQKYSIDVTKLNESTKTSLLSEVVSFMKGRSNGKIEQVECQLLIDLWVKEE